MSSAKGQVLVMGGVKLLSRPPFKPGVSRPSFRGKHDRTRAKVYIVAWEAEHGIADMNYHQRHFKKSTGDYFLGMDTDTLAFITKCPISTVRHVCLKGWWYKHKFFDRKRVPLTYHGVKRVDEGFIYWAQPRLDQWLGDYMRYAPLPELLAEMGLKYEKAMDTWLLGVRSTDDGLHFWAKYRLLEFEESQAQSKAQYQAERLTRMARAILATPDEVMASEAGGQAPDEPDLSWTLRQYP